MKNKIPNITEIDTFDVSVIRGMLQRIKRLEEQASVIHLLELSQEGLNSVQEKINAIQSERLSRLESKLN